MEERRSYPVFILFNGRVFNEVKISPHYEKRHFKYMNDELILKFVKKQNRLHVNAQSNSNGWSYFEINERDHSGRLFRIVICTSTAENYIGVINCYRKKG